MRENSSTRPQDGPTGAVTEPRLERSQGNAHVALDVAGGALRLAMVQQAGAARAIPLFQGRAGQDRSAEIVFINTSGGLCAGDRLAYGLTLGPGVRALATTQAAERIYKRPGRAEHALPARTEARFDLAAGAWLDWLPQETILYQDGAARRRTRINLAPGAVCLALEMLVLGRAAMGEQPTLADYRDDRRILAEGRPLWAEALAIDAAALAGGEALLLGNRALATLVLVRPDAADLLAPLRAVLDVPGLRAGASALPGRLLLRLAGADAAALRRQIMRALAILRPGPPPRVWQP